jgi:hypothetical protein
LGVAERPFPEAYRQSETDGKEVCGVKMEGKMDAKVRPAANYAAQKPDDRRRKVKHTIALRKEYDDWLFNFQNKITELTKTEAFSVSEAVHALIDLMGVEGNPQLRFRNSDRRIVPCVRVKAISRQVPA